MARKCFLHCSKIKKNKFNIFFKKMLDKISESKIELGYNILQRRKT